jgi:hypothetical protein
MEAINTFLLCQGVVKKAAPQLDSAAKSLIGSILAVNTRNYELLETFFTDDIMVYQVEDQAYISGLPRVMQFFRSRPDMQFELTNHINWTPPSWPTRASGVALSTTKNHTAAQVTFDVSFDPDNFKIRSINVDHADARDRT